MKNTRLRSFFVIACLCEIVGSYGCKKDTNSNPVVPSKTTKDSAYVDDVTYTGCNYAFNYVTFSPHVTGTGTLTVNEQKWDFGDGTTLTGSPTAKHIYNSPGSYTVSYTLNGNKVSKTIEIATYLTTSTHTAAMAGSRHWHGVHSGLDRELTSNSYNTPDTIDMQMSIEVMNGGIVRLPLFKTGITLNLTADDTVNKVLTFKDCTETSITLRYFYDVDSIVYNNYWSATIGHGYSSILIHTP